MSLLNRLNEDIKTAMRSKDRQTLGVLRLVKAEVQNEEINTGQPLTTEEELAVLSREAKQRRDSLAEFEKADRTDLVDKVNAEMTILEKYLPKQLSEEELTNVVKEVIQTTGANSMKEFGQVMGAVMPKIQGQADGKLVQQVVRQLLQA